jgi:hypothetical protein
MAQFMAAVEATFDPERQSESSKELFHDIRVNCLTFLATVAREIPALSVQIVPTLWAYFLRQSDDTYVEIAPIFQIIAPVFLEHGYGLAAFLHRIITILQREDFESSQLIYLDAVRMIVYHSTQVFVAENFARLAELVTSILGGQQSLFIIGRQNPRVPLHYRRPALKLLSLIVDHLRDQIALQIPVLYCHMDGESSAEAAATRPLMVLVWAKICRYCPGQVELAKQLFIDAWQLRQESPNREAVISLLLAFCCFFSAYADTFSDMRNVMMAAIMEVIEKTREADRELRGTAAALLGELIVMYDFDPVEAARRAEIVIANLWVRQNSEILPWVADFVAEGSQKWPVLVSGKVPEVAVAVLASDAVAVVAVRESVRAFLLTQLRLVPIEDLPRLCKYSEGLFARFQKTVAGMTAEDMNSESG